MNNKKLEIAEDKSCSLEPMWYCTVDLIIGSLEVDSSMNDNKNSIKTAIPAF